MILFRADAFLASSISKFGKWILPWIDRDDLKIIHRIEHLHFFDPLHGLQGKSETRTYLGFESYHSTWKHWKCGELIELKLRDLQSLLISHRILWYFCWKERIHGWRSSLQNSAVVLCFQFVLHLSQQVSLYSSARCFHLWHLDSKSEEFLDKVSVMNRLLLVDCQKRFHVSQTNSMYQIASVGRGST